jgi:hypothetical protein
MRLDEWQVFVRKLRQRLKWHQRQHRFFVQQRHQWCQRYQQRFQRLVAEFGYRPGTELSVQRHQSGGLFRQLEHIGQFRYVRQRQHVR